MGAVVAIDSLLDQRRLWKGQQRHVAAAPVRSRPAIAALDAALPSGGWPRRRADRTADPGRWRRRIARCCGRRWRGCRRQDGTDRRGRAALRAVRAGVAARRRAPVAVAGRSTGARRAMRCGRPSNACVRARARRCCAGRCRPTTARCAACRWPPKPGAAWASPSVRPQAARNPSPAALRIAIEADPRQLRVLKCRGGLAPARPIRASHACSEAGRVMRWVCLLLPQLALDGVLRRQPRRPNSRWR